MRRAWRKLKSSQHRGARARGRAGLGIRAPGTGSYSFGTSQSHLGVVLNWRAARRLPAHSSQLVRLG